MLCTYVALFMLHEFLTCSLSFGLWPHVSGSNEKNEINKKKIKKMTCEYYFRADMKESGHDKM